jgi:hypothetical protein
MAVEGGIVILFVLCSVSFEQPMTARNREGIGLSDRPARLQRPAGRYDNPVPALIDCSKIPETEFLNFCVAQESIPRNRFRQLCTTSLFLLCS